MPLLSYSMVTIVAMILAARTDTPPKAALVTVMWAGAGALEAGFVL